MTSPREVLADQLATAINGWSGLAFDAESCGEDADQAIGALAAAGYRIVPDAGQTEWSAVLRDLDGTWRPIATAGDREHALSQADAWRDSFPPEQRHRIAVAHREVSDWTVDDTPI